MKDNVKVLLIDVRTPEEQQFSLDIGLGLLYIAGYAMRQIDNLQINIINNNIPENIRGYKPHIVGISYVTAYKKQADIIIKEAKKNGAKVIVGGPHITLIPEHIGEADVGVIGEGELTFVELIKCYINNEWHEKSLRKISGIVFKKNNTLLRTSPRKPISNLDEIGYPARWLVPKSYTVSNTIISSRGCPFNCSFCCAKQLWPGRVRFHSVDYIIEEIKYLYKNYGSLEIDFTDDMFAYNQGQLEKFAKEYTRLPLSKIIRLGCNCRAEAINSKLIKIFKMINIKKVFLGLESGNNEVLKFLKGKSSNVESNYHAVELLLNNNIHVLGGIIIGSPDETYRQIIDTYRMVSNFKNLIFDSYFLVPLPGTPIWDYAKGHRLVSEDMDYSLLGGDKTNIVLNKHLSLDELIYLKRKFDYLSLTRKDRLKKIRKLKLLKDLLLNPRTSFMYWKYRLNRPRHSYDIEEDIIKKLYTKFKKLIPLKKMILI